MKTNIIFIILFFLFTNLTFSQVKNDKLAFPKLKGDYLGQKTPENEVKLFAPEIISTGCYERDFTMTPDKKEIYYSMNFGGNKYVTIFVSKNINGIWTEPEVASFATDFNYFYMEPHVQPDGKKMMFLSTKPVEGQQARPGWGNQNIWVCDRQADGSWGKAYPLAITGTVEFFNYYPTATNKGTVYFTRNKPRAQSPKIFRTVFENGKYSEPVALPEQVNGKGRIFNSFISPDESFLIACVSHHPSNKIQEKAEHYIFFRNENDNWSEGINLGEKINSEHLNASSQYITPDGKYFIFSMEKNNLIMNKDLSYTKFFSLSLLPENGSSDIYWIKADFIKELKKKAIFKN